MSTEEWEEEAKGEIRLLREEKRLDGWEMHQQGRLFVHCSFTHWKDSIESISSLWSLHCHTSNRSRRPKYNWICKKEYKNFFNVETHPHAVPHMLLRLPIDWLWVNIVGKNEWGSKSGDLNGKRSRRSLLTAPPNAIERKYPDQARQCQPSV